MPESSPARRRILLLPWLVLAPALALAGCGSKAGDEMESRIARAEAAAVRAENAQKGAEAAAARAENDKIAAASEDVDMAKRGPEDEPRSEPEVDPNQVPVDNSANNGPG